VSCGRSLSSGIFIEGEVMRAKELAKFLLEHPEFDVEFGLLEPDGSTYGVGLRTFEVMVDDIGWSSRVIKLGAAREKD
jgi:hypothetical protein